MSRPRIGILLHDKLAVGAILLLVLAGVLFYPVYYRVNPVEGLRDFWRFAEDGDLLERLNDRSGEPLWADTEGNPLPAGYPGNLGGKDTSENFQRLQAKLGGRKAFVGSRNVDQDKIAPSERYASLPSVPKDTWGNPWWLTVSWRSRRWALVSSGPDGKYGTADDLGVFSWSLQSFSMYWPMRWDILLYVCAGLWMWIYVVWRAYGLPRLAPWGLEVLRALVVLSPITALVLAISGGVTLPDSLASVNQMQLVPTWAALTLTVTAVLVLFVLWRRLKLPVEEAED